jgi:hypothetical protein
MEVVIECVNFGQPLVSIKIIEGESEHAVELLPLLCHVNIGFILYIVLAILEQTFMSLKGSHVHVITGNDWGENWVENIINYSAALDDFESTLSHQEKKDLGAN